MYVEEIARLVEEKFSEAGFEDCFLVAIEQKGKTTGVYIDSDLGIGFEKCQQLSRFLEYHIDRNKWLGDDYILEVSSPGLSRPLTLPRQYKKNLGRSLKVKLVEGGEVEGVLQQVNPQSILLSSEAVRKEGKKKIHQTIETEIFYSAIKEAKIIIKI